MPVSLIGLPASVQPQESATAAKNKIAEGEDKGNALRVSPAPCSPARTECGANLMDDDRIDD